METRRLERDKTHQKYILSDGTVVSGASTIAKLGDNPASIITWANRQGLAGIDTTLYRDHAANAGTISHFLTACYFDKVEPDLSEFGREDIDAARNSFGKFLAFWEQEGLTWIEHETELVSELYRYGGTLDLVARDNQGALVLLDWKGSKRVYDTHLYQISGYRGLYDENRGEPIKRMAIVLTPREEGDFKIRWVDDDEHQYNLLVFRKQAELMEILRSKPKKRRKKKSCLKE